MRKADAFDAHIADVGAVDADIIKYAARRTYHLKMRHNGM